MRQYEDLDYAATRLAGTIVSYNNSPVLVQEAHGEGFIVELLDTRKRKLVGAKDIDINPVKLGYVNTDVGASYVGRKPIRKDWRQGFRSNNSFILSDDFVNVDGIPFKNLAHTIKGKFPPVKDSLDKAKAINAKVAFDREWAVDNDNNLFYKEEVVGKWEDERFILNPKKMFLEQKLMEAVNENNL
jgi:hypothetical protein